MRPGARRLLISAVGAVLIVFCAVIVIAQQVTFRNAPASAAQMKNPYADNRAAIAAGQKLYGKNCAQCHGGHRQGMGPAPALDSAAVRKAKAGELFWFVSNGKPASGMPSWSMLPKQQRWQIVSFLQSGPAVKSDSE